MEINFVNGNILLNNGNTVDFHSFETIENIDFKLVFNTETIGNFNKISIEIHPNKKINLSNFSLNYSFKNQENNGFYCNGFQSWTDTRVFEKDEKIGRISRLFKPICKFYSDYNTYNYTEKKGLFHSWNYAYFRLEGGKPFFLAGINETDAYTLFEADYRTEQLKITKCIDGWEISSPTLLMDFFYGIDIERKCYDQFYTFLNRPYPKVDQAAGWTSWYHYYEKISEAIVIENLEAITAKEIPISFFQIDDGFQEKTGDWLQINKKFPHGMKYLADKIKEKNIQPGIWLAPFICSKKSEIYKNHPDWILKDEKGKLIKMGFNPAWDGWFYGLDIYHEGVIEYLKNVFKTVLDEWGFELVKLDFLFAAAPLPRAGKTMGKIMDDAMVFLRTLVGDKLILGCGVPLIPSMGRVDYCRIGPDIHLKWDFTLLKWGNNRERPSNLNAIGNTINRSALSHRGFLNDPDVFILRKEKNKLNFEEKYSLLLANVLFGDLIFTSDNLNTYDEEMLFLFKSIFPLQKPQDLKINATKNLYKCTFRIKERQYISFFNLSDTTKRVKLPSGLFFDGKKGVLIQGKQMHELKKHESCCLLNVGYNPFAISGTKGHLFPGCEVENIYLIDDALQIDLIPGLLNPITVYVKTPKEYQIESINGKQLQTIQKKEFNIIKATI